MEGNAFELAFLECWEGKVAALVGSDGIIRCGELEGSERGYVCCFCGCGRHGSRKSEDDNGKRTGEGGWEDWNKQTWKAKKMTDEEIYIRRVRSAP